jgi:non-ribosomal peptide synthetase component F
LLIDSSNECGVPADWPGALDKPVCNGQPAQRLVQDFIALQACIQPDETAITFYNYHGKVEDSYTFKQIDEKSTNLAWHIREEWNVGLQEPVLLVFPPGLDFVIAVIACFKAGAIAVPVQSPAPGRLDKDVPHLCSIVEDCGAKGTHSEKCCITFFCFEFKFCQMLLFSCVKYVFISCSGDGCRISAK